jgi:CubicO group peptidase (beta-lactamase class C family)
VIPGGALDSVVAQLVEREIPGLCVAVAERGTVSWVRAAGVVKTNDHRPMTPDTVLLWFSMTKIVTATAAVRLAEDGALDLDEPAAHYLPELPISRSGLPVTVRHLLSHTAGIAAPIPVGWVHPADQPPPEPHAFALGLLRRHRRMSGRPGGRVKYSNLGYIALGEIISKAAGQRYEDYVREHILQPLGMTRTGFSYAGLQGDDVATGHQRRFHPLTPLLRVMVPAGVTGSSHGRWLTFNRFGVDGPAYGGLIGSASDAARFLAMHTGDGEFEGVRILSREGAQAMRELNATGRRLDVGLGWFRRHDDRSAPERYVEHLGGGGGFWNMMRLYPEQRIGILAMGNATSYDHQRIARAVRACLPAG